MIFPLLNEVVVSVVIMKECTIYNKGGVWRKENLSYEKKQAGKCFTFIIFFYFNDAFFLHRFIAQSPHINIYIYLFKIILVELNE